MKHNIKDKLKRIDEDHYLLLIEIGNIAIELSQKAYLVGGMVRDLLLGFSNLDIDIVVENRADLLAEALVKHLRHCTLSAKHDRFHTAKVIFNVNSKKIPIDLASTRQEIYESPASLPKVKISDLKKDLYRRDFTINALAISLMPDEFGDVVDLFDGLVDLKNKKIRILHDLSFIDDPTRIIRAVRFATKFNFQIENHTQDLLREAINSTKFDNLIERIRGDRVKIEIRYLFNLPNIEAAIKAFFDSGIYKMISTDLKIIKLENSVTKDLENLENKWLLYFAFVIKDLHIEKQEKIIKYLQFTASETKIVKSGLTVYNRLHILHENNQPLDSMIAYKELKDLPKESVILAKLLATNSKLQSISFSINEFIEKTSKIKLKIGGEDLIKLGVKEGKKIGEILDKVLEKKIKFPNMSKEDEIKEAKALAQT